MCLFPETVKEKWEEWWDEGGNEVDNERYKTMHLDGAKGREKDDEREGKSRWRRDQRS